MTRNPFKKDWLVTTAIARGIIGKSSGERLPTVNEYCDTFSCSRGVVQNALAALEESGAVALNKRGKHGSFLVSKDEELLFKNAGLQFLTGSMPVPLNINLAGLATGVCQAMNRCIVPFTFAYVQGGRNRTDALSRQSYDFVVATRATAKEYIFENPDIIEAFPLVNCIYSLPYSLYLNRPGMTEVEDGMTVAADPKCLDQYWMMTELCKNKDVKLVEMPYISSRQAFLAGKVDAIVFREDDVPSYLDSNNLSPGRLSDPGRVSTVPIVSETAKDAQLPVVLVNRKNYGMAEILRKYLGGDVVSAIQKMVVRGKMAPQFY